MTINRPLPPSGRRQLAVMLALPCLAVSATQAARAASPVINAQGQVGLTSYTTLPFVSNIYRQAWGSSPYLSPGNLFWQVGSWFTNKNNMIQALYGSQSLTSQGIVASSGSQRWDDTWEVSLPASQFPGEPSYIAGDRNSGVASGPEFKAWSQWIEQRPNLPIIASDGGSTPPSERAWNGGWGHISPLMPLASGDCPTDMTSCTYGDLYAWRWGQTAALSGAYGIMLSDYSDSQPELMSIQTGFNPEIVAAFAAAKGVNVPSGSTAQKASWITANVVSQWNDYLDTGYAKFFTALSTRLTAATSQNALVIDQCSGWPAQKRFYGIDERQFNGVVPSADYMCIWDNQTMQLGRSGEDPAYGVGTYVFAAAREPNMRNGANLEANDSNYWQAIAGFNPTLDAADQQEKGLKLLKRSWLEASWAHIATRQGTVRRALAFMSRDYWDGGTLDPTLQTLISSIVPTAPFGFAVYYSVAAERALEQVIVNPQPNIGYNPYEQAYYNPQELLNLKNGGVPVGYYVSDAALPTLAHAAAPAAWLILEHPELIPASEMKALTAIAPVLTTPAQAASFAQAPLTFNGGLTGTGFYDQNNRVIVTVTNPAAQSVSSFVKLQGLPNGPLNIVDLFTNQSWQFTVASGTVWVPVTVGRWDTRAFALTPA